MGGVSVRFSSQAEAPAIERVAEQYKATKGFGRLWVRMKFWERHHVPIVAVLGGEIIGFRAVAFNKNKTVNSYYAATDKSYVGLGVTTAINEFMFRVSAEREMERYKFKSARGGPAGVYWSNRGAAPFAMDVSHDWYDLDIRGVASVDGFIEWMKHQKFHAPVPEREVKRALKAGAKLCTM